MKASQSSYQRGVHVCFPINCPEATAEPMEAVAASALSLAPAHLHTHARVPLPRPPGDSVAGTHVAGVGGEGTVTSEPEKTG